MSHSWLALLPADVRIEDGAVVDFGDAAAEQRAALEGSIRAPLMDYAVIRVHGADATDFLHAQLTNDIKALTPGESRLAAYCSPKGRMLAIVRIVRRDADYLLLVPAALIPALLKRLRMFVLRSKVALDDLSAELLVQGFAGDGAEAALRGVFTTLPESARVAGDENALVMRLPGRHPRLLVLADAGDMASLEAQTQTLARVGTPAWRLLQIEAGEPEVLPGGEEQWVPQMANLDLVGGISFTKGCYPGQEIVARMHYLGNLKRRLYRVRLDSTQVPRPGTEIRSEGDRLAGEIVMAAPSPDGVRGLAVLQIDQAAAASLHLDGATVTAEPPPYGLEARS